jgi:hypothetical protein
MTEQASAAPRARRGRRPPHRLRDAWTLWGGAWIFGALPVIAILLYFLWQMTKPFNFDTRICRAGYARARSASDTAAVDLIVVSGKRNLTCGYLRGRGDTGIPQ